MIKTEKGDAGMIIISVRDTGTGIDQENLEKIFEPFYTTKSKGMGMGLSINMRIIEAHGGRLWAENNPGRGATFYFTIPAS
jgi:signal transduction histidine kinase